MSTGENINANGAPLTTNIIRSGFFHFPQSIAAYVNPAQWPQIAHWQMAEGYPFTAKQSEVVPAGEVWFVGTTGETLGRIVNVGT